MCGLHFTQCTALIELTTPLHGTVVHSVALVSPRRSTSGNLLKQNKASTDGKGNPLASPELGRQASWVPPWARNIGDDVQAPPRFSTDAEAGADAEPLAQTSPRVQFQDEVIAAADSAPATATAAEPEADAEVCTLPRDPSPAAIRGAAVPEIRVVKATGGVNTVSLSDLGVAYKGGGQGDNCAPPIYVYANKASKHSAQVGILNCYQRRRPLQIV